MSTIEFLFSAWRWKPTVSIGCAALVFLYLRVCGRSRRAVAWIAGTALILIALVSPFDELADTYLFSFHMAKHLLFVLVVPALLLTGLPAPVARSLLLRPKISRIEHLLRAPAVAWTVGLGSMAFWHIPRIFNAALCHEWLHVVEHLSLLIGGTVYWWPVLSPLAERRLPAVPHAAGYLLASCLACTCMGVLITFATRPLYAAYVHPHDAFGILPLIREQWGISAAMDQQIGGLLMWVPACLVYLTAIMAMFARWYSEGDERIAALEA